MIPGEKIDMDHLDDLIERHMAFIIRTISNLTGRYVSVENDDEFSIALSAFAEAVARYDQSRGAFLGFARLVIESRLKSYLARENVRPREDSLEELYEKGRDFPDGDGGGGEKESLREEVSQYSKELSLFGLSLELLADEAPRHSDTRKNAIVIAEKASNDPPTVRSTYEKKRLPIRGVAKLAQVTEKVVKRSKSFILATMIIFVKGFPGLSQWIAGSRCSNVL